MLVEVDGGKRNGHFQIYPFQDREISDQNRFRRIFPLAADAARSPQRLSQSKVYRFLHPCSKKLIKLLQLILQFNPIMMIRQLKQIAKITCKSCGAKMEIIRTI